MDKNIPLSELIRIGCKASPVQCYGELYRKDDMATCAIGAAHLAKTGELNPQSRIGESQSCYALMACGADPDAPVFHPGTSERRNLSVVILSLNDGYGWTRERIADWLESIGM